MRDLNGDFDASAAPPDEVSPDEAPPEFGLLDVVEAFTAMRHDWRGQTKESRAAIESVQDAVSFIRELEAKLRTHVDCNTADEARLLAKLIAETDHHLTRAVATIAQSEANRRRHADVDRQAVQRRFEQMNPIARWFARPLLACVIEQHQVFDSVVGQAEVEGLNLVLARLRGAMRELQIERVDTVGEIFDANTMNAIGTVESEDYPEGRVVEQLAPGYRWRGQLLRFADVRVAA